MRILTVRRAARCVGGAHLSFQQRSDSCCCALLQRCQLKPTKTQRDLRLTPAAAAFLFLLHECNDRSISLAHSDAARGLGAHPATRIVPVLVCITSLKLPLLASLRSQRQQSGRCAHLQRCGLGHGVNAAGDRALRQAQGAQPQARPGTGADERFRGRYHVWYLVGLLKNCVHCA